MKKNFFEPCMVFIGMLWFFSLVPVVALAQERVYEKWSDTRSLFGTIVRVEVCYVDTRRSDLTVVMDRLWTRWEEIDRRFNPYSETSDISRLNRAAAQPVDVHEDVWDLLSRARPAAQATRGAVDVTVGPLIAFWNKMAAEGRLPSREEVLEAKALVGLDRLRLLPENRAQLTDPAASVDLSSYVSGYALDEALRILKEGRFHNFMVDAGGEIYAAGSNCAGRPWHVGLQDPSVPGKLADVLELRDRAVSTSGDYEKFLEIGGNRLSHIINPLTGYPVAGAASATVVAPTGYEADMLSTALCVLGPVDGLRLIRDLGPGYAAMMLFRRNGEDLELYTTREYDTLRVEKQVPGVPGGGGSDL